MTATEFRCGLCGAELPPDSRFCNKCDAPVTQVSRSAEYQQVTVPSVRKAIAVGIVLLILAAASSCGYAAHTAVRDSAQATLAPVAVPAPTPPPPDAAPAPDFATVSKLMNDAIAARTVPGGVVVIGYGGKVVFHQAYGSRKLAGEPGLDGSPAPAEPMTEDTIFDIASLTKCLAT